MAPRRQRLRRQRPVSVGSVVGDQRHGAVLLAGRDDGLSDARGVAHQRFYFHALHAVPPNLHLLVPSPDKIDGPARLLLVAKVAGPKKAGRGGAEGQRQKFLRGCLREVPVAFRQVVARDEELPGVAHFAGQARVRVQDADFAVLDRRSDRHDVRRVGGNVLDTPKHLRCDVRGDLRASVQIEQGAVGDGVEKPFREVHEQRFAGRRPRRAPGDDAAQIRRDRQQGLQERRHDDDPGDPFRFQELDEGLRVRPGGGGGAREAYSPAQRSKNFINAVDKVRRGFLRHDLVVFERERLPPPPKPVDGGAMAPADPFRAPRRTGRVHDVRVRGREDRYAEGGGLHVRLCRGPRARVAEPLVDGDALDRGEGRSGKRPVAPVELGRQNEL